MPTEPDAVAVLKKDHKKVKELFDKFEKTRDTRAKRKIAEEAIQELKVHARVEEELFYPAVRREVDEAALMNEAREEHHVAKLLIAELEALDGDDETFEAKFTVLAENVRHHIKEEEGEMFPEAKKTDVDLAELGTEISRRKEELMAGGVPPTPEETMVRTSAAL